MEAASVMLMHWPLHCPICSIPIIPREICQQFQCHGDLSAGRNYLLHLPLEIKLSWNGQLRKSAAVLSPRPCVVKVLGLHRTNWGRCLFRESPCWAGLFTCRVRRFGHSRLPLATIRLSEWHKSVYGMS